MKQFIATPKPALVKAFKAGNKELLEKALRKALEMPSPVKQLNAINRLFASALQGYLQVRTHPMPEDQALAPLWDTVKQHLVRGLDISPGGYQSALDKLAQGLTSAVNNLSSTMDRHAMTGEINEVSPSEGADHRNLDMTLFGHTVFTLIVLLLVELQSYVPL
jgi:hypothetical protein